VSTAFNASAHKGIAGGMTAETGSSNLVAGVPPCRWPVVFLPPGREPLGTGFDGGSVE
jgi:hypothetical protein